MAGPVRVDELANAAADESRSLLEQLQIVRSVLLNSFLSAAEAADRPGLAIISGRLLEALRELGKLTGELREVAGINVTNNTLNLIASPQFLSLQTDLLDVCRKHPSARSDIIGLLRSLDTTAAGVTGGLPASADRDVAATIDRAASGLSMRPGPPLIDCVAEPADAA